MHYVMYTSMILQAAGMFSKCAYLTEILGGLWNLCDQLIKQLMTQLLHTVSKHPGHVGT